MKDTSNNFVKTVHVGYVEREGEAFAKITYFDGKLSIFGVIGTRGGNATGSSGQWIMSFREYDDRGHLTLDKLKPAPGWTKYKVKKFLDIWDKWHLNDSRAGCEHQREWGWGEEPIDPTQPTTAYGTFYPGQTSPSWNLKGCVYPPFGHLAEACPECGYKYGTAWLFEEVPNTAIKFLRELPDTDVQPA